MGKGKGQRTKNNARPSNSSRSAEFLGASAPGFAGFTVAKDGGYVSLLPGVSITSNTDLGNIDTSFQLVLKKMNKKDATTKYKALLEFGELCKNSELTTVEAVLPFWPRVYGSLCIDVDHRVREAVQVAHSTLVKRVGKAIATYLKQLAGPWFVAQYDMYPPAASAASNCFNSTFPQQKIISAIVHCQDEILNYICDNIINLTPQALATNKSLLPEEIEAKYQRILSSSLQAYSYYLKTVTASDIEKTVEYHKKLVSNNKFWKLSKNEVPQIKTAFFGALTALICYASSIVCEDKKKILTSVMNSLDETEPALLAAVWECLLVAINKIEDWHKVVSIEKLVLPKLWKVLRNGGQHCANVVYPNLLPLLSQFMKFEIDNASLFVNFFDNMRHGFSAKSVKLSRSEAFAVVTSFIECFKYAILVESNNEDFCNSLLKDQLMPVVESCICEEQMIKLTFFCELTQLVRYWSKNSENSDYSAYSGLTKTFCLELLTIFNRLVDNASESYDVSTQMVVDSMAELLTFLRDAPEHSRRNMRVKFSDSPSEPAEPLTTTTVLNDDALGFLGELEQLVIKLSVSYFKKITEKPDKHKIINLVKIISGHESKELFVALAKTYDENASLLQFYNQNLKILMTTESDEIEALVNLIFGILSHMNDSEKVQVLHSFEEVNDVNILRTAVQCALIKKYREDETIRDWCKQEVVTNTLVSKAQDVQSSLELSDSDEKIFIQAFEPTLDGDLRVSCQAISGISSLLCSTVDRMSWDNEKQLQRTAFLLSRLLALSWTHREINQGSVQLLKAIFRLHVRDNTERTEDDVESAISCLVQEAWTKGLHQLSKRISETEFAGHIKYFASIIWEKTFATSDVLKEPIINLSTSFIDAVIKSSTHYSSNFVITFLTELEIKKWIKHVSSMIVYAEVITGDLYASILIQKSEIFNEVFDIDLCKTDFEDNTHKCLKWATVSTKLLNNLLSSTSDLPEISEILINLSYVATLGELYIKHYNSTRYSNDVNATQNIFNEELKILKTFLPDDVHIDVIKEINRLLLLHGGIFPHVLRFYCNFFYPQCKLSVLLKSDDSILNKNSRNNEISLQSAQILSYCSDLGHNLLSKNNDNSDFYQIFVARNQLSGIVYQTLENAFERITKRQQTEPASLILDCDIFEVSWEDFILPFQVISFFTECVTIMSKSLTVAQWDIIEICLASWNLSVKKSIGHHQDFKVKALIIGVSNLYCAIQKIINKNTKQPIEELPPSLCDEWKNVFSNGLRIGTFDTWMAFAELFQGKRDITNMSTLTLNYLGRALRVFDEPVLKSIELENKGLSKPEDEILQLLLQLIHCPVLSLQLGTYIALNNFVDVLVERDKSIIEVENFDPKSLNICKFEQVLRTAQTIVDAMLMDFKLCDTVSCTIQPYTDSYTYTIGYVFTWNVVLNMCSKAHGDLRYYYAEILKDNFFPSLLNNIFRLMPIEVLQDSKNKNAKLIEIFSTAPSLDFNDCWTEWRLDHLVCWLYTNCLRYLPVLVRQWWSTAESRVSAAVDKITTLYASPFLCNEELTDNRLTSVENMQVKVHPTAREVVALYQMDDTKLELNIILPTNHPLGTVTVEPGQHAGGTANWRNCHMQLSIFLTHQNGSIWDGLMLWKANLDKRFAGVEECYICFSIFHISTYQIPKLSCQTCRKKFHKPCLYKWFNTSHKSTCPICRNVF